MNERDPRDLRTLATRVTSAGDALWDAGLERRARWLADAFALLANPETALGRTARDEVPYTSGLSDAMVSWALESALKPLTYEALCTFDARITPPTPSAMRVRAGQLCVVVLAGNVFTAAARGVAWPLLLGWPVFAKASSEDDTFARLLQAALAESDATLADAYQVVTFPAEDEASGTVLFEQADAVSVYGGDGTLNAIRARVGATVSFIGHGHGLGAAFIDSAALADERSAREIARHLALDVAAYDQRGCLSPHIAWVTRGATIAPQAFAELVQGELAELRTTLPRGPLPLDVASAQLSWRGIGAIRGTLLEGDGFAVSYEEQGALRVSPGYRNLQLIGIDGVHELTDKLTPLGVHLKCLGVAGVADARAIIRNLPARVAPRVCALGSMQRPPVDALHDGVAAWDGLVRWSDR